MRQVGYTLVEVLVVVLILGVVAAALLATHGSVDAEQTLEAAAGEVAAALRFARSEAMRTGEPHGVEASTLTQRVRVYQLDISVSPPVVDYSVRHPVDKKLYHLDFSSDPMLAPVSVTSVAFWYSGLLVPQGFVGFNPDGTPKYTGASTYMLASGAIDLAAGDQTRVVSVAPMTGRVTVQ
jgi:prepilin-type N-terminal cleavage/methylation domain-containing protein